MQAGSSEAPSRGVQPLLWPYTKYLQQPSGEWHRTPAAGLSDTASLQAGRCFCAYLSTAPKSARCGLLKYLYTPKVLAHSQSPVATAAICHETHQSRSPCGSSLCCAQKLWCRSLDVSRDLLLLHDQQQKQLESWSSRYKGLRQEHQVTFHCPMNCSQHVAQSVKLHDSVALCGFFNSSAHLQPLTQAGLPRVRRLVVPDRVSALRTGLKCWCHKCNMTRLAL